MQVRRLAAWTVLPLAATLGLAACGGGDEEADAAGVVRIEIGEPKHLLPTNTAETAGSQVLSALFSPLVDFDDENRPVEVAAASVESADNKVWTIKLKDGYTFHDGEKVTSDHYINAWNYGAYGPNGQDNNYFFDKIEGYADLQAEEEGAEPKAKTLTGLQKVDDSTFTVTLSEPYSEFKAVLGYTAFYPLPSAAWASEGVLKDGFEDAIIGQGPFKIKGTWQHDAKIEVERYDAFPGAKPKIAGVEFRIYQSPEAGYADLMAGNLDVVKSIPTANLASAESDLGARFKKSPASTFQFLAFPLFDSDYQKVEVRRAISMAIDRDEIINAIFKNSQSTARSFVSPVVAGYRENSCGEFCQFDAAKAKELYTSAGGPAKLQITYNADGGHKEWVDATCNQLKNNLGVDCVGVGEAKFADLLTKAKNKEKLGMFRMGWVMDYPSMENYLGPIFSTSGSSNYYGYSNPAFDTLVREGAAAPSQEEAIKKYQAAEDLLVQDMPVIPLRFGQNVFGHSEKVKNVEIDLFNRVNLLKIEAA
jgi:oligopeptide transport system substrate-binding protein